MSLDLTTTGWGSGGYTCSQCGAWVPYGNTHFCNLIQPQQQSYIWPTTWSFPVTEQMKKFRGAVKTASKLPSDASVGDAYYVEDLDALFVRVTAGWLYHGHDD